MDIINYELQLSLLLILMLFFSSAHAEQASLSIRKDDLMVKTLTVKQFRQLQSDLTSLTVDNPTDSKVHVYQGILLKTLLTRFFGKDWQQFDALKFSSQDGYQPIIPIANVMAHTGMIAITEKGQQSLSHLPRINGETVNPAPFFLIWENINDAPARTDEWLSWPWQLTDIELTHFAREYPNSAPPATADEKVTQGFLAFRQHCMKCHAINGDGGEMAPELNYPVNVTEYWQPQWLARFIDDPQSVRANSKMIAFYRDVENRAALIETIIAYLKRMKNKKITAAPKAVMETKGSSSD
ncbi:hypothetical protein AU255_02955 [Methyloprofundus sedimenti]|uniref:Cytochrome c domain-containing protein n=1 Tax=Methyloprofundus sedimenti TaxID=1420851 RepID=A0A1V8M5P9_9GAMM|nr:cytochrome c [Methyloprofundus sedimenti]OQK16877.1 hypothetical protein AU255_02955 [Methyloprofundus sedimenti]